MGISLRMLPKRWIHPSMYTTRSVLLRRSVCTDHSLLHLLKNYSSTRQWLMPLSPLLSLGLDKFFIASRLSPEQFLLIFKLLVAHSKAPAVETLRIEGLVHLCTKRSAWAQSHAQSFEHTRRRSRPHAGPMPPTKCFSTPSRPSASLFCTLMVFPSAAPHSFATSSSYSASVSRSSCISEEAREDKNPYRPSLFSSNHNLLAIPHPPLILYRLGSSRGDILSRHPTNP